MLGRLGQVIYWACTGVAVLLLAFAAYGVVAAQSDPNIYFFAFMGLIFGVGSWLLGRAVLYVLAGR